MKETILTGVAYHPAVFPVRPSEIENVVLPNFHGPRLARRVSRIKNKLRPAFRASRSILDAGLFLLFRGAHGKVGLKTRSRKASANEPGSIPVLRSSVDGIGMGERLLIRCIRIIGSIFAGRDDPFTEIGMFGMATAEVPPKTSR
jgi:hypothetical protein